MHNFFYVASIHTLKKHILIEKYRHARNYEYNTIEKNTKTENY